MSLWLRPLRGLAVVDYGAGGRAGSIQEIHLDVKHKQLAGLTVRTGPSLLGESLWLPAAGIKKVGREFIFIPRREAMLPEPPSGRSLGSLLGRQVTGPRGKIYGHLEDLGVARTDRRIETLALSGGLSLKVEAGDVVLGEDLILVRTDAEPVPRPIKDDGDAGLAEDVAELVGKYAAGAYKQGGEWIVQTSQRIQQLLKTASPADKRKATELKPKSTSSPSGGGAAKGRKKKT